MTALVLALGGASEARAQALGPGAVDDGTLELRTPQLQASTASGTLHLQPEGARLLLKLPAELMPASDLGLLGALTGQPMDPNKHWDFRAGSRWGRASLGAGLRLSLIDPRRSLRFDLEVLPRAAFAELRFDPVRWAH